jgi:hypothetical protein
MAKLKKKRRGLFDHCDACIARTQDIGWLDVLANEKGQQAVAATFAEGCEWTRSKFLPPGWSAASINLPKLIEGFPAHNLAKISIGPAPPGQVIAEFDYARRLAVSLVDAGCRVCVKEGDKATDYKLIVSTGQTFNQQDA